MRKMLFIYNPRAGRGAIRNSLSYILEEFSDNGMDITVHPTNGPGDAADLVCSKGSDFDLVVCSGGDGTLDEVVTGLMRGNLNTPVGYIPAGSTNDFANSLKIPTQMRKAAADIAKGRLFTCDVGKLNDRFFIYVAAFGVFTEVSYKTSQDMKNMLGHVAYLLEGVKSLSTLKSWKLKYTSKENSGEGEFLYGMITNSNSVGGFKGITGNDVNLNDGLFEVTLIKMAENIIEWPAIINALLTGTPYEKVISFKTSRIEIECDELLPWTADGEYGGAWKKAEVENMPKALHIVLGEHPEKILSDDEDEQLIGTAAGAGEIAAANGEIAAGAAEIPE